MYGTVQQTHTDRCAALATHLIVSPAERTEKDGLGDVERRRSANSPSRELFSVFAPRGTEKMALRSLRSSSVRRTGGRRRRRQEQSTCVYVMFRSGAYHRRRGASGGQKMVENNEIIYYGIIFCRLASPLARTMYPTPRLPVERNHFLLYRVSSTASVCGCARAGRRTFFPQIETCVKSCVLLRCRCRAGEGAENRFSFPGNI